MRSMHMSTDISSIHEAVEIRVNQSAKDVLMNILNSLDTPRYEYRRTCNRHSWNRFTGYDEIYIKLRNYKIDFNIHLRASNHILRWLNGFDINGNIMKAYSRYLTEEEEIELEKKLVIIQEHISQLTTKIGILTTYFDLGSKEGWEK